MSGRKGCSRRARLRLRGHTDDDQVNFSTLLRPADLMGHLADPNWLVLDCRFELSDPGAGERAWAAATSRGACMRTSTAISRARSRPRRAVIPCPTGDPSPPPSPAGRPAGHPGRRLRCLVGMFAGTPVVDAALGRARPGRRARRRPAGLDGGGRRPRPLGAAAAAGPFRAGVARRQGRRHGRTGADDRARRLRTGGRPRARPLSRDAWSLSTPWPGTSLAPSTIPASGTSTPTAVSCRQRSCSNDGGTR